jgi:hypothetical protein
LLGLENAAAFPGAPVKPAPSDRDTAKVTDSCAFVTNGPTACGDIAEFLKGLARRRFVQ